MCQWWVPVCVGGGRVSVMSTYMYLSQQWVCGYVSVECVYVFQCWVGADVCQLWVYVGVSV